MATHMKGVFVTCLLLFVVLMEEAKPVLAQKSKKKRLLKERVDILEGIMDKVQERLKALEQCQACSMLKELKEKINELQEKVDAKPTVTLAGLEKSEILEGDASLLTALGEYLKPVMHSDTQWKRCWQASVDKTAEAFHSMCDDRGPTVTIVRVGEYIFGGYTADSWAERGRCWYKNDREAFLFSLVNNPGWSPVKLNQTGEWSEKKLSIYTCHNRGPSFGGGSDFQIADNATSNAYSNSHLGYSYSPPQGYRFRSDFANSFLAGSEYFKPDEVEVFYETTDQTE